jgi:hypothetical protein
VNCLHDVLILQASAAQRQNIAYGDLLRSLAQAAQRRDPPHPTRQHTGVTSDPIDQFVEPLRADIPHLTPPTGQFPAIAAKVSVHFLPPRLSRTPWILRWRSPA